MKFSHWFNFQEFIDSGPFVNEPQQDRRWDLARAGTSDGLEPGNPMKSHPPTAALPTYDMEPLPGNKKAMKKMKKR